MRALNKISIKEFISELDSFYAKEDLSGAEKCLMKWKSKASLAKDKSGELTVLNEMTGHFRQTKDEKNAMSAIKRAFELIEELNIENEISAATIYLNGATTIKSFGKSAEAMEFYDKAHKIYKNKLPENSPLFAGLYNNKALALQDLNDNSSAKEYFEKAIKITEGLKGCELETAVSCINLAHLLYSENSENGEIDRLVEKALSILENPLFFGYEKYAFTCRKCAPSFGFFGFFLAEKQLNERANKIYAGS